MGDRDIDDLADCVQRGDRRAVAEALNLLDDSRSEAQQRAETLLSHFSDSEDIADSHLIGITGPPGVGKSTLIAALIRLWRADSKTVGVLAVDPSSPLSGGALLGDRLRIKVDGDDEGVLVRSLSDRGQFGGLSPQVWPMALVMLNAFDIVVLETVGVGQREIDVASSCDSTCFVAQPGSGDSIQFLKAGVLEIPHILVVNKADMGVVASRALTELRGAVQTEHPDGQWQIPVLAVSAAEGTGIDELAEKMQQHFTHLRSRGDLPARRRNYQAHWLLRQLEDRFGRAGIDHLGGAQAIQSELAAADGNPLLQIKQYTRRLL